MSAAAIATPRAVRFDAAAAEARTTEERLLPRMRRAFDDDDLECTRYQFHFFDYVSQHRFIELKCRSAAGHHVYADWMFGCNKIAAAAADTRSGREYIFVNQYRDGKLWYWKYDPAVKLRRGIGGRVDRGIDERREYYFIPAHLFRPLPGALPGRYGV